MVRRERKEGRWQGEEGRGLPKGESRKGKENWILGLASGREKSGCECGEGESE